jgi:GMP synthase (glutamine-hydrolysing)
MTEPPKTITGTDDQVSPVASDLLDRAAPSEQVVDAVVVLDFGSQYAQLIARRVREAHVYCELLPHDVEWKDVARLQPRGVILSGGPASVYAPGAPQLPGWAIESGLPVLGICYGMQLLTHHLGGRVAPAQEREYGPATITVSNGDSLFHNLPSTLDVWMSHGDRIEELPPGFQVLAASDNSPYAAMGRDNLIGIQFHPEVSHTPMGPMILRSFL